MTHKINAEDFEMYEFSHQIAGSFGRGEHKELLAVVKGGNIKFEVRSQKILIETTTIIAVAVAAYNDA